MAKPKWKTNLVFLVVFWVVLLVASLTVLSSAIMPFLKSLETTNLLSSSWGGYSVSSDPLSTLPQMSSVSASWTIPTVNAGLTNAYSAAWIGIGGEGEPTLIQTGSQHDYVGGQAYYSLWYELLPDDSVTLTNITVSPGDKISASINLLNGETSQWRIEIIDVSTGQGFSQNFFYNSSRLSAEWIVERPTVNNKLADLANFGSITFTAISVEVQSKTGTLADFPNSLIMMQDSQNHDLVSISPLSKDGQSFTVNYGG